MDITTLPAWGEFLTGIAVVVSLIYLASQIRINAKTVRASNYSDLPTNSTEFRAMIVDPDTASLYLRGLDDFAGLSTENQIRFHGLMVHLFNSSNRAWHLHQQSLLADESWGTRRARSLRLSRTRVRDSGGRPRSPPLLPRPSNSANVPHLEFLCQK